MTDLQIVPPLLSLLHEARERHGYMPHSAIKEIAQRLNMPVASLLGICDGYDAFREHEPIFEIGIPDCPTNIVRGALMLYALLSRELAGETLPDGREVVVRWVSCHGRCVDAPYFVVDNHVYTHVKHSTMWRIIAKIRAGSYKVPHDTPLALPPMPEFAGFTKAISMGGEAVVNKITKSGLLGFGGALFSAGTKWKGSLEANLKASSALPRILFVNFDEGEAGTCKDGAIVRGELPHFDVWTLMEGILISAFAVKATDGIIYTRYEYPRELDLLNRAITHLYDAGLLGTNILGTGWSFTLQTVRGAGGYVRGELTAGMNSAAGGEGIPQYKTARTSSKGYRGWATLVNNVETIAWSARIIRQGATWYQNAGFPRLYTVTGDVQTPQVIPAPQNITLGELIELAGGLRGREILMAIPGGNATVPIRELDAIMNKEGLKKYGSSPGSGAVMVVSDQSRFLLWKIAEHMAAFFRRESCQQCALCRIWTRRAHEQLRKPCSPADIELMRGAIEPLRVGTLCGLGQGALPPVVKAAEVALQLT